MNLRSVSRRASRVLLGATLVFVALGAVSATAMAAPVSGLTLPPDGKVKQISAKPMPIPAGADRLRLAPPPFGNDDIANALIVPMTGSLCRFPNYCFVQEDSTEADEELGETLTCSGENFDSTLWYYFEVDRVGLLDVVINNTLPDGTGVGQFRPSFFIFNADDGNGFCGAASTTTSNFETTLEAGPGTTLGTRVFVQIGALLTGSDGGTYDFYMRWHPDSDGDSLLDGADRCPNESGPTGFNGCPDSDSDNIPNPDDRCPAQNAGSAGGTYGGCPDADGDSLPEDGSDKCPGLNPNRLNRNDRRPRDGCPDILVNAAAVVKSVAGTANGIRFDKFTIKRVVRGASVKVTCKLPGGRKCGGLRVKRAAASAASVQANAARNLRVRSLIGKSLPYGTTITVRVTARYATGRFIRIKVVRTTSRISEKTFCMRPGSRKLRKRGCA